MKAKHERTMNSADVQTILNIGIVIRCTPDKNGHSYSLGSQTMLGIKD